MGFIRVPTIHRIWIIIVLFGSRPKIWIGPRRISRSCPMSPTDVDPERQTGNISAKVGSLGHLEPRGMTIPNCMRGAPGGGQARHSRVRPNTPQQKVGLDSRAAHVE